jgi:16S rRNA (guanine1207-N2)-methyltransferase
MPTPLLDLLAVARPRLRPPVAVVHGAPRLIADLAAALGLSDTACYQMDLHQADRLRDELRGIGTEAEVLTAPDLWDLPARFNTVLLPSPPRGDRELKRDLVEQAHHVLVPGGRLVVLSPVPKDRFFPAVLKKVYGKVVVEAGRAGTVLWGPRGGDRPRRRHEITFHVREPDGHAPEPRSLVFKSRPGVFTYGRMDAGARALIEAAEVRPGDRVVDLGCGTGTVGVLAGLWAEPGGSVTFVDSNLRAAALAEENARANGLTDFRAVAAARLEGLPAGGFDVVLANPPYYAQQGVARLFVEGAKTLLRRGGRLYVVTKQADTVGEIVYEHFGEPALELRRDYAVLVAKRKD